MKIVGGLVLSAHHPGLASEYLEYLSALGGLELCLVISLLIPSQIRHS